MIIPKEILAPNYTLEEKMAINEDLALLFTMRTERDRPHPELDDMTYIQYYESNRKKDLSYLPPKKNPQDIRISTGLTREKDTTLLSTLLGMNFEPAITGFDTDDLVVNELGDNMSDLVRKSREIEIWEKKRPIIYREMISQGDVFTQELWTEDFREMPLSDVDWDPDRNGVSEFSIKTRMQKIFSGCSAKLVTGKKVYLGSTRIEYIEDQDAVAILNVYSRRQAYSRYGMWERWKNIPTTIMMTEPFAFDGPTYRTWNLVPLGNPYQVAEVILYNVKKNRLQIYLNGIAMLPHNYPLTAISPSGEIPMAQGKLEPISDFSYSKSIPSKTKIDQEVLDETTKLMIEGMRLGRKPPMGSGGKKVYSPSVLLAGKITPDLKQGDLFPILANAGLTPSDFSFYQLIKQGIADKTSNDSYDGNSPEPGAPVPTATQINTEQQQQALKLGSSLDGCINLEKRMSWNRLYTILENYTAKFDKDMDNVRAGIDGQYRSFSVSSTLENGEKGTKIFRMKSDSYPNIGDHARAERDMSKHLGHPVRIVFMNPEELRQMKYSWFIIINPTQTATNDALRQVLFISNLQQAITLFGPQAINQEYAKQRFAIVIKEDYNKFFNKMTVQQMMQMGLQSPDVQNAMGNGTNGGGQGGGGNKGNPAANGNGMGGASGGIQPAQNGAAGPRQRPPLRAAIK